MPRIQATLQNIPSDDVNWFRLRRVWEQMARIVNGLLSFGDGTNSDNVSGVWSNVATPGAANTDFTITHNLQRAAVGYLVMAKDAACDVYTSPTVNADPLHTIILRATATGVNLRLFIL